MPLFRRDAGGPWDLRQVAAPWGDRPSIYRHLQANLGSDDEGLTEDGETLPDEERLRSDNELWWAPGALDGVMSHHMEPGDGLQRVRPVLDALKNLTRESTSHRAEELYEVLLEHSTLEYVQWLSEAITQARDLDQDRLCTIARWLAEEAADREAVKAGLAILGHYAEPEDRELFRTLGAHEEFTLFATAGLVRIGGETDRTLWKLARRVRGWGRIQVLERLAHTTDPEIRDWLLRDGYRNEVMYEYTAHLCATAGDMVGALRRPNPDTALLRGCGEILSTLIDGRGGPARDIGEYSGGAEAAELFLTHVARREPDLSLLLPVLTLRSFVREPEGEARNKKLGWPARRQRILELVHAIREQPGWEPLVRTGLASAIQSEFNVAAQAAEEFGLDAWDAYFARLERGEGDWYFVMQTDDPGRIDRVLALAERRLNLGRVATGPGSELGLGPGYQDHHALDFILQDLARFPGKGWPLIRAGLRSPVVRNRNMAVKALRAWGKPAWPREAEAALKHALAQEPEAGTRGWMAQALRGVPLEEEDE